MDFAEKTVSGAGSTHHTNGIMVILSAAAHPPVRSGARSFKSTACVIKLFFMTSRHGPTSLAAQSIAIDQHPLPLSMIQLTL